MKVEQRTTQVTRTNGTTTKEPFQTKCRDTTSKQRKTPSKEKLIPWDKKRGTHLQVPEGEDDGVREVHLVGVLVYRGRDDGRVDDDGVIGGQGFAAQLDGGVLRGQVNADVFVEDEGDPDLTCGKVDPIFVSRSFPSDLFKPEKEQSGFGNK